MLRQQPFCLFRHFLGSPAQHATHRTVRCLSTSSRRHDVYIGPPQIAVIGSGPAGYYTAQHILNAHSSAEVDIYEKLPVPFGLVRYGVAPDHPDVKNVINTFTNIARSGRCRFLGNVTVGRDVSMATLRKAYAAVVLSYGADDDKAFNIPGEDLPGVMSARAFVGWYNGLPENAHLQPDLDCETAVVLGQGNVAIDVARMLLTPVDELMKTDTTDYALDALQRSRVKRVYLVGRRGPLQVAFTTAELREMVRLEGCRPRLDPKDFKGIKELIKDLPRPRRRLTELLVKTALDEPTGKDKERWEKAAKEWSFKFLRSPVEFLPDAKGDRVGAVRFAVNKLEGPDNTNASDDKSPSLDPSRQRAIATDKTEDLACGVVFRSIGYKSISISEDIPFDSSRGVIPNVHGKVEGEEGLYCSGWVKTGPVGVIVSTMNNAYDTGKTVMADLDHDLIIPTEEQTGREMVMEELRENGVSPVSFEDWEKIDRVEKSNGERVGKPREKLVSVKKMLDCVKA